MCAELNPYAPPQGAEHASARRPAPSRSDPPRAAPFRSARARAYLAGWFAGSYLLASVLFAVSTLSQIELLKKVEADAARNQQMDPWERLVIRDDDPPRRSVSEAEMFDNDQRQRMLSILYTATGSFSFLFLLLWLYRAYCNLPALGVERPRFSPGWAVGYWFVPVLNLIRPCQVMVELAQGSDPRNTPSGRKSGHRPGWNTLILVWWIGNVLGGAAGVMFVVSHAPSPRPTPDELIALSRVMVWVLLGGCTLVFLQILIVLRIDRDQESRRYAIQSTVAPNLSFLRDVGTRA